LIISLHKPIHHRGYQVEFSTPVGYKKEELMVGDVIKKIIGWAMMASESTVTKLFILIPTR